MRTNEEIGPVQQSSAEVIDVENLSKDNATFKKPNPFEAEDGAAMYNIINAVTAFNTKMP